LVVLLTGIFMTPAVADEPSRDGYLVDLATDSAGDQTLLWGLQLGLGSNGYLQTRERSAAGAVSTIRTITRDQSDRGSVVIDADGTRWFVWFRQLDAPDPDPAVAIEGRRQLADGSFGPVKRIISADDYNWLSRPSIAVNPAGGVVVGWTRTTDGTNAVVQARRWATNDSLGTVKTFTSNTNVVGDLQLAVNAAGDTTLIWNGTVSAQSTVQGRRWFANDTMGPQTNISQPADAVSVFGEPHFGLTPSGDATIAWSGAPGNTVARARRWFANGSLGAILKLSPGTLVDDGTTRAEHTTVAVEPDGDATIAWVLRHQDLVQACRLDDAGNLTAVRTLSTGTANLGAPEVVIDPNGVSSVVWRKQTGTSSNDTPLVTLYGRRLADNGSVPKAAQAVSEQFDPSDAVAFDTPGLVDVSPTGNVTLMWHRRVIGRSEVRVRTWNAAGALGTTTTVAPAPREEPGTLTRLEEDRDPPVDGLEFASGLALSPDGKSVYVTGAADDAVVSFKRNTTNGALAASDLDRDVAAGGTAEGLDGAISAVVSPDGKNTYVAGYDDDTVVSFTRNTTSGNLTRLEEDRDSGAGGTVNGLTGPIALAVSPDGKNVYAATELDGSVVTFSRDTTNGRLTAVDLDQDPSAGGTAEGLAGAEGVVVSPNGKNVYAVGAGDDAVVSFTRSLTSGKLTRLEEDQDPESGGTAEGMDTPFGLAISPNGATVYVSGNADNRLPWFSRDPATGRLTWTGMSGRYETVGGPGGITVSPNSENVYVATFNEESVEVFRRDPFDGWLTWLQRRSDVSLAGQDEGLDGAWAVAASPDSKSVYVTGANDNTVVTFSVLP
jgi:6-phosphogluconolactonase (cycloisomerase 2 family)